MVLGDVLKRLTDDAAAADIILGAGGQQLLSALRERAEAEDMELAEFSRAAVRRYSAEASEEEWATMLGMISRADDPGTACLRRALGSALKL